MNPTLTRCLLGAIGSLSTGPAAAATDVDACLGISADAARLACYDRAVGRLAAPLAAVQAATTAPAAPTTAPAASTTAPAAPTPAPAPTSTAPQAGAAQEGGLRASGRSTADSMVDSWELAPDAKQGVFKIKSFAPTYVLPLSWRQKINLNPCSPNPLNCVPGYGNTYLNIEAKFQISAKTKAWQDILGTPMDLWLGYTQQSFWQLYDATHSRPFRDTSYQPEGWLTVPLKVGPDWLQWRMFNLGLVHQSNGEPDPTSRSWNRLYATFGLKAGDLSILLKPWWRIVEHDKVKDNNPDISDYMGRGEIQAIYTRNRHVFQATLVNNRTYGASSPNRSNVKADWAFPLYGDLHGYVLAHYGWGESMLNYNFRNTGIGIGVSVTEWR